MTCEPLVETESLIRETAGYIEEADRHQLHTPEGLEELLRELAMNAVQRLPTDSRHETFPYPLR